MSLFAIAVPWVESILDLVTRASLHGAIAVIAVWAVCRLVPSLPAAFRCWLWWLACLKLVLGLVWTVPMPLRVLPAPERVVAEAMPIAAHPGAGVKDMTVAAPEEPNRRFSWGLLLVALWGVGASIQLVWASRQLCLVRAVVQRSAPICQPGVAALFAELRRKLDVSPRVEVLASAEIQTPQVFGLLRPRVLLPAGELERLSAQELAMTLCHELLHVRRGDLWLGWVPATAQRLFFFHPLAWLAAREYALAREAACDAEVLRVLDSAPEAYGRLLLTLGVKPRVPRLAAAGAAPSFQILQRRLEMLQQALDKKRIHPMWLALLGLLAITGMIPFQMVAQEAAPQQAERVAVPRVTAVLAAAEAPVARVAASERTEHKVSSSRSAPVTDPSSTSASPAGERAASEPGSGRRDSFVVLVGGEHIMDGTQADLERALQHLDRVGVWFERNGKAYVIRDVATARQIEAVLKPQRNLVRQQDEWSKRQAELSAKEVEILTERAELAALQSAAGASETKMRDLEGKMRKLDQELETLQSQRQELMREDAGRIGQRETLVAQAEGQVREILDRAITSGLAQVVQ